MLIQTPEKNFLADLRKAINYAKDRPPKLKQNISECFGPGIAGHQGGGSGSYHIQVSHWTDGTGEGSTVLVLQIAVATTGSIESKAFKKHPLASEAEVLLTKYGACIKLSVREDSEQGGPLTWLVTARWN